MEGKRVFLVAEMALIKYGFVNVYLMCRNDTIVG